MSHNSSRRDFLRASVVGSAAIGSLASFEERILLASMSQSAATPGGEVKGLAAGKIGDVTVSRILCGGNLIGGFAHSRDLLYVSSLMKHYFTDEKIMDTLEICEQCGVNTINAGTSAARVLNRYWNERGGKIQWFAQCGAKADDISSDAKTAIDNGAAAAYLIGNAGDAWARAGQVELIGKFMDYVRSQGVLTGTGAHNLGTTIVCEEASLPADFYMKTLHRADYWSARKPDQTKDVIDNYAIDNYWDKDPDKTIAFMKSVKKPWIAYKVLAAGAIAPQDGFRFAFENGADFCCVGMFDFQVREDVIIAKKILAGQLDRKRPWRA